MCFVLSKFIYLYVFHLKSYSYQISETKGIFVLELRVFIFQVTIIKRGKVKSRKPPLILSVSLPHIHYCGQTTLMANREVPTSSKGQVSEAKGAKRRRWTVWVLEGQPLLKGEEARELKMVAEAREDEGALSDGC